MNGISLTIADCDATGDWFGVAVIPHTYALTNLEKLNVGEAVNLEGDILGKYVQRLLAVPAVKDESAVDASFLMEHGYL